jgi:peptidoglycan/xylan/chitin deacetylase (PgdA/CDA1 family)
MIGRNFSKPLPLAALVLISLALSVSCATNAPKPESARLPAPAAPVQAQLPEPFLAAQAKAPAEPSAGSTFPAEAPERASITVQFDNLAALIPDPQSLAAKNLPFRFNPRLLVLIYHNLVFGRTGNEMNRDLYNFVQDLSYLGSQYRFIRFGETADIARGTLPMNSDAVAVTFDDGDLSMYMVAYPLLKAAGIKATFFIVPSLVGETCYMTWAQIREMAECVGPDGEKLFEFGSHTMSHISLAGLSPDRIYQELDASKKAIKANAGIDVDTLSLPYGDGPDHPEIRQIAASLGYKAIRTSNPQAPVFRDVEPLRVTALGVSNIASFRLVLECEKLMGRIK